MSEPNETPTAFAAWFEANASSLATMDPASIADAMGEYLVELDGRLGLEVSVDDDSGDLEVIFTAFSDPTLFECVQRLVLSLGSRPGWAFTALKPPRGFEFEVTFGKKTLDASGLEFGPIEDVRGGLRLCIPDATELGSLSDKGAEEMAWLVVETGIGEELAGRIQHLEFDDRRVGNERPIKEMADYVSRLP